MPTTARNPASDPRGPAGVVILIAGMGPRLRASKVKVLAAWIVETGQPLVVSARCLRGGHGCSSDRSRLCAMGRS
jgi:hypothetical protein